MTGKESGRGNLLAAVAEAGFLIGLEKNRFNINNLVKCFFFNINTYHINIYKYLYKLVLY